MPSHQKLRRYIKRDLPAMHLVMHLMHGSEHGATATRLGPPIVYTLAPTGHLHWRFFKTVTLYDDGESDMEAGDEHVAEANGVFDEAQSDFNMQLYISAKTSGILPACYTRMRRRFTSMRLPSTIMLTMPMTKLWKS